MKRFLVLSALLLMSATLWAGLSEAVDPSPLVLTKECVLFGRVQGSHLTMYPAYFVGEPVYELPAMTQIKGFEVLNTVTGEWHPLTLSEDGYFCANISPGRYELRGRDCKGQPYVIHSFNIPRGMAVNLGSFRVNTCNPELISREGWQVYVRETGWRKYAEGDSSIGVRLEHVTSENVYENCEDWFAQCHKEVFDQFSRVIARR